MNTNTAATVAAEIVLTCVEGRVFAFVNGEQVATTKNSNGFIGRIEKALRAAHVYRTTGYAHEAGAFIAEGTKVAA